MGLEIVHLESGRANVTMPLSDDVRGNAGVQPVHGGMLATLADVVSALALWGCYDIASEVPVTTDMHIRYYRQPRSSPITAESRVVHKGRRLFSAECVITDPEDRQIVRATGTYMIVPFNA